MPAGCKSRFHKNNPPLLLEITSVESLTNKTKYGSFFSVYYADLNNVLFDQINSALFEVVEATRSKFHQVKNIKVVYFVALNNR